MLTDQEKQEGFDRIAEHFYNRNFGTMSKADLETLLFDIYIEHLLNHGECFDDHTMSKTLGISQSRVRNLKIKKELKYPHDGFDWKESFAEEVRTAVYDPDTHMISMRISDVNVLTELRYFTEINGLFDHYQLNPHVFSCRLDFFLKICEKLSEQGFDLDDEAAKRLKELQKNDPDMSSIIGKFLSGAFEDGCKALVQSASKEAILAILRLLPFGGVASTAVRALIKVIEKS